MASSSCYPSDDSDSDSDDIGALIYNVSNTAKARSAAVAAGEDVDAYNDATTTTTTSTAAEANAVLETNNDDDNDVGPRMHLEPPELPPMAPADNMPHPTAPPPQTNDNANNDKKKGRSAMLALVDMLELPPSCRSFANYLSNTTVPVLAVLPTTVPVPAVLPPPPPPPLSPHCAHPRCPRLRTMADLCEIHYRQWCERRIHDLMADIGMRNVPITHHDVEGERIRRIWNGGGSSNSSSSNSNGRRKKKAKRREEEKELRREKERARRRTADSLEERQKTKSDEEKSAAAIILKRQEGRRDVDDDDDKAAAGSEERCATPDGPGRRRRKDVIVAEMGGECLSSCFRVLRSVFRMGYSFVAGMEGGS